MSAKERLWKAVKGQLDWDKGGKGIISVPVRDLEDRIYYAVGTLNGTEYMGV